MAQHRAIIITGVSRSVGIGAAIARRLAAAGYDLFLTYYRPYDQDLPEWHKHDDIAPLSEELAVFSVKVGWLECNLAEIASISMLFDCAETKVGAIYGLINNACFSVDTTIDTLTPELLDQHYALNARAPMLLTQEFVRRFRQQQMHPQGRIITLTSGYESEPNPGNLAYSATKAAMNRFTNSVALEVAGLGITVNSVDPGPTDTGWMPPELKADLLRHAPMQRLGTPDDAAKLIEFLVSDNAQWITGQILHSRGGF